MTDAPGGPRALDGAALALVAEGCTRSGVVWLRPGGRWSGTTSPGTSGTTARCTWSSGGGEQELPALTGAVEVVVPSKDAGAAGSRRSLARAARARARHGRVGDGRAGARGQAPERRSDPPSRSNSGTGGRGTRR